MSLLFRRITSYCFRMTYGLTLAQRCNHNKTEKEKESIINGFGKVYEEQKLENGINLQYVIFSNGTVVFAPYRINTLEKLNKFATLHLRQMGRVYVGTERGDFYVGELNNNLGWMVLSNSALIATYIPAQYFENNNYKLKTNSLIEIGFVGREFRDNDAKNPDIIYSEMLKNDSDHNDTTTIKGYKWNFIAKESMLSSSKSQDIVDQNMQKLFEDEKKYQIDPKEFFDNDQSSNKQSK